MQRLHVRHSEVYDSQVRSLADREIVTLRKVQAVGTVFAGHLKSKVCVESRGILADVLLGNTGEIHLPEHIERVVRGGPVCPYSEIYTGLSHLFQRSDPACEFQIGSRIGHSPEAFFSEQLNILIIEPGAVEASSAVVEKSDLIQKLRGREPVSAYALLSLRLCLAYMREGGDFVFVHERRKIFHSLHRSRILRMDPETVPGHVISRSIELQKFALDVLYIRVEIVQRRADDRPEAALAVCPDIFVIFIVHVEAGRYTARDVFHYSQLGEQIYSLRRQLGLLRKDLVVQPLLKRQIIGVGP